MTRTVFALIFALAGCNQLAEPTDGTNQGSSADYGEKYRTEIDEIGCEDVAYDEDGGSYGWTLPEGALPQSLMICYEDSLCTPIDWSWAPDDARLLVRATCPDGGTAYAAYLTAN